MTIREDIEKLESDHLTDHNTLLLESEQLVHKIEDLEDTIDELKMQLKTPQISWRNDPDPYGYHRIPIMVRLEEMGYQID